MIKYIPDLNRKSFLQKVKKGRRKVDLEEYGQLNLFNQGKVIDFHDRKNLFELALELDNQGSPKAESIYLKAIEKGESIADAYCNLGILKAAQGNLAKSIDYFIQALTASPSHIEAQYNIANMYFDAGNFQLAINHYRIAMEIDPHFPEVYFNLGLAYASLQNYAAAAESLVQYKTVAPNDDAQANAILKKLQSF